MLEQFYRKPLKVKMNPELVLRGLVPVEGVEPTREVIPNDFESFASANSATPARQSC
jgi:hypothetical protein